jgi:hypothetical protein
MESGAEIDPGDRRAVGLVGLAGHVDRAGHHLADAVEADALRVRAAMAIGRAGGEDDVGLHRGEGVIVEPHGAERRRRQVRHHHIGGTHQTADDLLPLRRHRVERERALVAVHLQEKRAHPVGADGSYEAVLAALALLDADDLGALLGEQRRAIGAGDVAAEIQDPNAPQNTRHARFYPRDLYVIGKFRRSLAKA